MLANPNKDYKVTYLAGVINEEEITGSQEFDTHAEADAYFVDCFNQLSETEEGRKMLLKGTAFVKMFYKGDCIINSAQEAARI